tara:strand:+ start:1295 stop:1831 length:537 start_codon:yes stop_codon:yes gene_type:complete
MDAKDIIKDNSVNNFIYQDILYQNPYSSNTKEYGRYYYYAKTYENLTRDQIIEIITDRIKTYKYTKRKPREPEPEPKQMTLEELNLNRKSNNHIGLVGNDEDINNKINEDDKYIYYRRNVWSKNTFKFLKILTSSKGEYCKLTTTISPGKYQYRVYYLAEHTFGLNGGGLSGGLTIDL